jgi:serine protease Do
VTVEHGGRVLGIGTILNGDGRILTALSGLGGQEAVDVRYADGSVVHTRVGHKDKPWDLALLVPASGHWTDGLPASEQDPSPGSAMSAFVTTNGKPAFVTSAFKGKLDARGKDGEPLQGVLDLDLKGATPTAGTPVLDAHGAVVGILVRACRAVEAASPVKGPLPCTPFAVAVPIPSIRHFLAQTPAAATTPSPWLGVRGESDLNGSVKGVRILAIAPGSPAEKGGLRANAERAQSDLVVAVDGQPVDSPEKLGETIAKHAVGDTVKLLVYSGERFRELNVVLKPAP